MRALQPPSYHPRWPGGFIVGLEPERGSRKNTSEVPAPKVKPDAKAKSKTGRRRVTAMLKGPLKKVIVAW